MDHSVEIDTIDRDAWHRLLGEFDDGNIFQTWAYGTSRWGDENLSHAVVKRGGDVVGLAQLTLVKVPIYGALFGYAIFGPVWRRRGGAGDMGHYRAVVRALEEAYVARRGLALRLRPWTLAQADAIREAMRAQGAWQEIKPLYETYVLDLRPSLDDLHDAMDRKWRANLRKAEAQGLRVLEYRGRSAIDVFAELSGQTQRRKHYTSHFMTMFEAFYPALPDAFKPRVLVCESLGRPVAVAIISVIGERAFYLNGASSDSGLELRAGYRLQWHVVRLLKEMGSVRWYDLYGGLETPGVMRFKRGIVGAKARATTMPEFQATGNALGACLLRCASGFHDARTQLKGRLAELRGQ